MPQPEDVFLFREMWTLFFSFFNSFGMCRLGLHCLLAGSNQFKLSLWPRPPTIMVTHNESSNEAGQGSFSLMLDSEFESILNSSALPHQAALLTFNCAVSAPLPRAAMSSYRESRWAEGMNRYRVVLF